MNHKQELINSLIGRNFIIDTSHGYLAYFDLLDTWRKRLYTCVDFTGDDESLKVHSIRFYLDTWFDKQSIVISDIHDYDVSVICNMIDSKLYEMYTETSISEDRGVSEMLKIIKGLK